jgi:ACR3 family arsenite efflux pump ArsB
VAKSVTIGSNRVTGDKRTLTCSVALSWVIGPVVTFALAWL